MNLKINKILQNVLKMAIFNFIIYANSIESKNIIVDGYHIHYLETGKGANTLFLLTGRNTTSYFWNKKFISCLDKEYKIVMLDYPGVFQREENSLTVNNLKKVSDLYYKISRLISSENNIYFIGWSMGGAIVQEILNLHYMEFNKSVLIAPLTKNNRIKDIKVPDSIKQYKLTHPLYFSFRDIHNFELSEYANYSDQLINSTLANTTDRKFNDAQLEAVKGWVEDKSGFNADLSTNILTMIPEHDERLSLEETKKDITQFKHSTISIVHGSGHNPSLQNPDLVCNQIIEFLK